MARINIEERWWTDPRRRKLIKLIGSEEMADGLMISIWRISQTYWSNGRRTIPEHVWNTIEHGEKVVQANLAINIDGRFYVNGSDELLDWTANIKEKASKAGKASAEARRKKYGSAQPKGENPEHSPNKRSNTPNDLEPSDSGSGSDNKNTTSDEVVQKTAAAEPKQIFPICPELNHEPINDILQGINPQMQKRWIKVFQDPEFIKKALEEAISFYTARGDANSSNWAILLNRGLYRAKERGLTQKKGQSEIDWQSFFESEGAKI